MYHCQECVFQHKLSLLDCPLVEQANKCLNSVQVDKMDLVDAHSKCQSRSHSGLHLLATRFPRTVSVAADKDNDLSNDLEVVTCRELAQGLHPAQGRPRDASPHDTIQGAHQRPDNRVNDSVMREKRRLLFVPNQLDDHLYGTSESAWPFEHSKVSDSGLIARDYRTRALAREQADDQPSDLANDMDLQRNCSGGQSMASASKTIGSRMSSATLRRRTICLLCW